MVQCASKADFKRYTLIDVRAIQYGYKEVCPTHCRSVSSKDAAFC